MKEDEDEDEDEDEGGREGGGVKREGWWYTCAHRVH